MLNSSEIRTLSVINKMRQFVRFDLMERNAGLRHPLELEPSSQLSQGCQLKNVLMSNITEYYG